VTDGSASLQAVGDRWEIAGPLTMDTVAAVLAASRAIALPQTGVVELAQVDRFDSAGLSLLLSWTRRAAVEGRPLRFGRAPESMRSLAELYGVEDMLPT
jgi:phospholipid transport system transporter-binding protein